MCILIKHCTLWTIYLNASCGSHNLKFWWSTKSPVWYQERIKQLIKLGKMVPLLSPLISKIFYLRNELLIVRLPFLKNQRLNRYIEFYSKDSCMTIYFLIKRLRMPSYHFLLNAFSKWWKERLDDEISLL